MNDFFDHRLAASEPPSEPAADGPPPVAPDPANGSAGAPAALKTAVQDLLRCGLVERAAKPNLYRTLTSEPAAAARVLEPLDLTLAVDDVRGIAYLCVARPDPAAPPEEAWQHPLVRRQRLTTEQSLLVAILRQAHIAYEQQMGIGAADARADLDGLQSQFDLHLGDTGSQTRNRERLLRVLSQLKEHGIVGDPDPDDQVAIRPIIVHLANPEHLGLLLEHFRRLARPAAGASALPAELPSRDPGSDA